MNQNKKYRDNRRDFISITCPKKKILFYVVGRKRHWKNTKMTDNMGRS